MTKEKDYPTLDEIQQRVKFERSLFYAQEYMRKCKISEITLTRDCVTIQPEEPEKMIEIELSYTGPELFGTYTLDTKEEGWHFFSEKYPSLNEYFLLDIAGIKSVNTLCEENDGTITMKRLPSGERYSFDTVVTIYPLAKWKPRLPIEQLKK